MLDVIHYLYEEDLHYSNIEEARWVDAKRKHIYKELYDVDYKYFSSTEVANQGSTDEDSEGIKPYIPPTEFDPESLVPFGSVLDAPIN